MSEIKMDPLLLLGPDVFGEILKFCRAIDFDFVLLLRTVCKSWNTLIESSIIKNAKLILDTSSELSSNFFYRIGPKVVVVHYLSKIDAYRFFPIAGNIHTIEILERSKVGAVVLDWIFSVTNLKTFSKLKTLNSAFKPKFPISKLYTLNINEGRICTQEKTFAIPEPKAPKSYNHLRMNGFSMSHRSLEEALATLTSLERLNSGDQYWNFPTLTRLTYLQTGTVRNFKVEFPNLRTLKLEKISTRRDDFMKLTALRTLKLDDVYFGIHWYELSTTIQELKIRRTKNVSIPQHIEKTEIEMWAKACPNLKKLSLDGKIKLDVNFQQMNLKTILIKTEYLSETIQKSIAKATSLEYVRIFSKFNSWICSELKSLPRLKTLQYGYLHELFPTTETSEVKDFYM